MVQVRSLLMTILGVFTGFILGFVLYKSNIKVSHTFNRSLSKHHSARREPVIMCMIFTTPEEWERKALAVRLTWAKRCDIKQFFYSKNTKHRIHGAYALDVPEGRNHLSGKTFEALKVSYRLYGNKADWFMKIDDDAYIIMENLRYLLRKYNSSEPCYVGFKFNQHIETGYNCGGASYGLSRQTVKMFVEQSLKLPKACPKDGAIEDLDMGRCLAAMNVYPINTNDKESRAKFHPIHPVDLLDKNSYLAEHFEYTKGNNTFGKNNEYKMLSPETITFHHVPPGHMYVYDFLLYDLKRL